MYSGRLDISLSGLLVINFSIRITMIIYSAGTCLEGALSPVQSGLDVSAWRVVKIDIRGSRVVNLDVFVKGRG